MDKLIGKHKRFLRALGNKVRPKVFVGKGAICETLVRSLNDVFNKNELVKVRVEKNCTIEKTELARRLVDASNAHLVQILGNTILLYRPDKEKPLIDLPS